MTDGYRSYMLPDSMGSHLLALLMALGILVGFVTAFMSASAETKRREGVRSLPTVTKRITTMGTVTITIMQPKPGKWSVVKVRHDGVHSDEFLTLMCAAEYLSYLVAMKSNLDFEKALNLISKGAMNWRWVGQEPHRIGQGETPEYPPYKHIIGPGDPPYKPEEQTDE